MLPGKALVDAAGVALGVDQQVLGAGGEAQRRARHRFAGLDLVRPPGGRGARRAGPRERGLGAEASRAVDAAQQHLQQVDGAAGMEAVGMRRYAAHRVHRDRPADHLVVLAPGPVRPGHVQLDFLLEGGVRQFGGDAADGVGRHAGLVLDHVGRVLRLQVTLGHQFEGRPTNGAVFQREAAAERGRDVGQQGVDGRVGVAVPGQRLAVRVAQEQAVLRVARFVAHQPGGVGVAHQELEVDFLRLDQFVDQSHHEQAVGAGPDADPFVGDRRVARAHRVDRHELGVFAALQQAEAGLDRVGVVVLGDAEHHEVAREVPVGLTELPERAADGVQAGGRHVDRTETAVGCVVRRAELGGPERGQRLALVAAGEEGQFARVVLADIAQPLGGECQRLVPGNRLVLAAAARSDALERFGEPRRRQVLHDARGALAAQHALVDGVVGVPLDVTHLPVAHVHADTAAAGTHVTGGFVDFVGDFGGGVYSFLGEEGHARIPAVLPGAGESIHLSILANGNKIAGAMNQLLNRDRKTPSAAGPGRPARTGP